MSWLMFTVVEEEGVVVVVDKEEQVLVVIMDLVAGCQILSKLLGCLTFI